MRVEKGFTLVEILIVVVILGILAAIVIPQFTSASTEARESALKSDLQAMRSQIELYKIQHLNDALPGAFTATFLQAMEGYTDVGGAVVAAGTLGAKGPYMRKIPVNPFSSAALNLVRIDGIAAGAGTDHWRFDTTTGAFQADDTETDPVTGDAHSTY
ncbi:MAG: prepilin-type N-terminal cleavage/methylation domain-containing protein [Planctomycetes bacterium]|nr:prepilin-type N-terminal cleavage/methylation domain-containing protein [Planctomycetota bacterium]